MSILLNPNSTLRPRRVMVDKWDIAHMETAKIYAKLSSAKRLKVGCVIVKDRRIISIGYNGMPSGWDNECEYLDKEYVYQPKRGFGIPLQKLMKGILLDEINEIINSSCNDFTYLKINYFKSLLEKSKNSAISHLESILLWKLLILLKWSKAQKLITKVKE